MARARNLNAPEGRSTHKRPDVMVARLAAQQWGVLSFGELRTCGLTSKAICGRVENGRLHRVHRCVYAVGHPNVSLEGRFLAAVKACGDDALLSHFSAAALWGLVRWDGRHVEVTVPASAVRSHARVRVHRSLRMEAEDQDRHRGVPVTSPARTLLDVSPLFGARQLRRAVREALALRVVDLGCVVAVLARLGPRAGSRRLAGVVVRAGAPTRSMLEDVVLDLLLRGGFAHPDVNVPLLIGGRRVVPDFRWPAQRLVVEADGAAWHEHRIAREDDATRQALLEAHGERVLRVTWEQAMARPAQTRARIAAAGAPLVTSTPSAGAEATSALG